MNREQLITIARWIQAYGAEFHNFYEWWCDVCHDWDVETIGEKVDQYKLLPPLYDFCENCGRRKRMRCDGIMGHELLCECELQRMENEP